ncbi:hypothetical protein U1Q18_032626 [Sarracenia purpurea var. burkii]
MKMGHNQIQANQKTHSIHKTPVGTKPLVAPPSTESLSPALSFHVYHSSTYGHIQIQSSHTTADYDDTTAAIEIASTLCPNPSNRNDSNRGRRGRRRLGHFLPIFRFSCLFSEEDILQLRLSEVSSEGQKPSDASSRVPGEVHVFCEKLAEDGPQCDRIWADRMAGAVKHSGDQRQQSDGAVLPEHWI